MLPTWIKNKRILLWALGITALTCIGKVVLHLIHFEPIPQTSLHNSLVSSTIFVIGFVLSATITDYKESERIPAEFASNIEDMYNDASEINKRYPEFDLNRFRGALIDVLDSFREGTHHSRQAARREIAQLHHSFGEMEAAGVPPNFITKLKQQQSVLLRNMFRVNYIQRIKFIPSATLLVRSISVLVIGLLLLTSTDSFYGSLMIGAGITFIIVYIQMLIQVVSVPFHKKGATKDDVSLFLLREAREYLVSQDKKVVTTK